MKRGALAQRLIQLAFLVVAGGVWYALTATGAVSPLFLPSPVAVYNALARLVGTNQFWNAVQITLVTIAKAYGIAIVLGILAGYLVTRSKFLTEVFEPIIAGLFTVPITLFFPMFILFFGIGPGSKVAYGATYGFFPIALNTIAGLGRADERYLRAARSMGASRWNTFRHVLIPSAFPVLITGLRVGFFICFASVLGGEALSSVSGVGRNIALAAELMESARMYAWIAFVIITAVSLNLIVSSIEARATAGEASR
jgi:ABC-type nitrate/sulfonate/bicarbonate transport system permease component